MKDPQDPIPTALKRIHTFLEHAKSGRVTWQTLPVPRPGAMRSFQGRGAGLMANAVQANVEGVGVVHECMVIDMQNGTVTRCPPDIADQLYHLAAQSMN